MLAAAAGPVGAVQEAGGIGLVAVVAPAQTPAQTPTGIAWQSAGDSFSSGEGVLGNKGACAQSQAAFGPAAATMLRTRGWQIVGETFTACTGHLVEDYFNARAGSARSLWDWGREQGGPERVDVLTMSFGGNDIGFADVVLGCVIGLPGSWTDYIGSLPTCSHIDDMTARIDALLDPTSKDCSGNRLDGTSAFNCDLDLGDRRGSIIDFYYDLVTDRLTDRGRLVVVGYPKIFADLNQWPGWAKISCEMIKRGDTEKLGVGARHLNKRLNEAVDRANRALGERRVLYIDRLAAYETGRHELCGTNDDWLNGLMGSRGQGFEVREESSFHPNLAGHDGIAPLVVAALEASFPRPAEPVSAAAVFRNATLPAGTCAWVVEYWEGFDPGDRVTLENGRKAGPEPYGTISYVEESARGLETPDGSMVIGLVHCTAGGSGQSYELALLAENGNAIDHIQIGEGLGESRAEPVVTIAGGEVEVAYLVTQGTDAACCPTREVVDSYAVSIDGLKLLTRDG